MLLSRSKPDASDPLYNDHFAWKTGSDPYVQHGTSSGAPNGNGASGGMILLFPDGGYMG